MMAKSINIEIFKWIHSGAGKHPIIDSLAVLFGEGGPYFLVILFAVLWFLVDRNRKMILLEATEASID